MFWKQPQRNSKSRTQNSESKTIATLARMPCLGRRRAPPSAKQYQGPSVEDPDDDLRGDRLDATARHGMEHPPKTTTNRGMPGSCRRERRLGRRLIGFHQAVVSRALPPLQPACGYVHIPLELETTEGNTATIAWGNSARTQGGAQIRTAHASLEDDLHEDVPRGRARDRRSNEGGYAAASPIPGPNRRAIRSACCHGAQGAPPWRRMRKPGQSVQPLRDPGSASARTGGRQTAN
jgi:hypothetical protein